MNGFGSFHPLVSLVYFVFVIGFSMFFMHPVCLAFSFVCAFAYSFMQNGRKAVRFNLVYMLPLLILTALINPAFNHAGITILTYLPDGNPLTLESVIYGACAALMLAGVICWFSCFGKIMTSDKIIYLFGKVLPSLSLIFSMTLRFVPKFMSEFKKVANAQKGIGRDMSSGSIVKRARNGLSMISIITTKALENAIDTADSMKSRGYGIPGRSAFSIFRFGKRDLILLVIIFIFGIYCLTGGILGAMEFSFFPMIVSAKFSAYNVSVFAAYFMLCILPVIIELREVRKWNALRSAI